MYTSASISSIIQTSGPIFTIILAIILLRESSDFKKVCGAIIALTGTILLILSRDRELSIVGVTVYGNFLILLSSVSYAFASILTKKGLGRIKPLEMLGYSTFIGFIALTIAAIPERPLEVVKNLTLELWAIVFLLAVFPTFIACLLWYKVMISEEVSRLILFVYLMPVFAVLFSFILLGEIISPQTIIFAIMIIGGVALAERTK
jgi:drug/metabolite transporter (DMT)-like permease